MNQLTPILKVARDILLDAGQKGLHSKSIAELAVAQNKNMGMTVEEFQKKVQSALAAHLRKKTGDIIFAPVNHYKGTRKGKPMQGWFRLKLVRKTQEPPLPIESNEQGDLLAIPTAFLGKAGEYAVMSELLFWNFNTSIMTVDDGVDIVASKGSNFFLLQVKTAKQNPHGKFQFSIKKSSYERYSTNNTYYVFVLREKNKNDFIVIPRNQIEFFINTGKVNFSKASDKISISIYFDNKEKIYRIGNGEEVHYYLNNFGVIR